MDCHELEAAPERAQWGRQIEFILTLVGYAVGLGNIWRFPYLCYKNGGGAFLIPYLICLLLIGLPVFALEVSFGQFGGKGPISIWYINPALKGIGYAGVMISGIISIYYDCIIAWGFYFLFSSMTDEVPWKDSQCDDCACLLFGKNDTDYFIDNRTGINCSEYFRKKVLSESAGIDETGIIKWDIMLCNLLSWLIVFAVLSKGIKSLGKVVYFTAIFPYIILTILLIRSSILEGAATGILYYLKPDWSRLTDPTVWSDAAVQIFFSLSACQGGLVAMASYNKFSNNVLRDAIMVPIINCLTSFYAGFVVFATLGYMAHVRGVDVSNVTASGPGLAFVAYPEALANMPITPLWAILFFFMLCILGFSSQFSIVETVMTAIIDEFPRFFRTNKKRVLFRIGVCLGGFILGMPIVTQSGSYWLDLIDSAILGFPTLFNGLFELIAIAWVYGYTEFAKDIEKMVGRKPFFYFRICWCFVSPVLVVAVIVGKAAQYTTLSSKGDPVWTDVLWWIITISPTLITLLWFLYYTCSHGVFGEFRRLNKPLAGWRERRITEGGTLSVEDTERDPPPYTTNGISQENMGYVDYKAQNDNMGYFADDDDAPPATVNPPKQTQFDEATTHM
ncbi:sodium- and chloride-dependent glycine transporter 1-like [Gigantopelta aegis]|uniref:sodium- and chloride-dependent glycine transporter 1-like n=1 Tax=Gigantopelta aegis TaxID=1735272 RepID=UPI001B88B2BF|nr:sodium- and chloride-dependent glycine transporter 1-like [Gigantopelta aegis]